MSCDISVIIPVYNAEKYLNRCLDSILSQTFQSFEIILIDDCSTDNSSVIIHEYINRDSRIKLIQHIDNCGPMIAREHGWKIAKGDFFLFVDCDDSLLPDALYLLYDKIKRNKDVDIVAGCIRIKSVTGEDLGRISNELPYGSDRHSVYKSLLEHRFSHSLCGKIYRRQLFNNEIKSYDNYRNGEDAILFYKLVSLSNSIVVIDNDIYEYIRTENSSTRRRFSNNQIVNYLHVWDHVEEYISAFPDLYTAFYENRLSNMLSLLKMGYDKAFIVKNISYKEDINLSIFLRYYSGFSLLFNILIYYSSLFRYLVKKKLLRKYKML